MDNFEHIREDGMFDTDELNVSGVLADNGFDQFYMTSEGAGIFMDNMGYEKIIQKTTVTDSYTTEDYEPSGKIETSSSRTQVTEQVGYKKPYSEGHYPQVLGREMPEQRQFYYGQSSEIKGPYRPTLMLIHTNTIFLVNLPNNY